MSNSCRLSRIIMQPLQCRTTARTTTTMWTARWCSISSMYLSVRFSLRNAITFQIIH